MFAQPRIKKSTLPPPSKKRKNFHSIEEINFDDAARQEYLTGFHKRKVERQKHAKEVEAQRARQEKIEFRKSLREEQKQAVEDHVKRVNEMLREAERAGRDSDEESEEEWGGFEDEEEKPLEPVDHEEEYIDEDKYTTVTVEAVEVDRHGFHKPGELGIDEPVAAERREPTEEEKEAAAKKTRRKAKENKDGKKKKKFTYESKVERQLTSRKQKASRRR